MNSPSPKKRLSKVMAAAGVASRRACEELIFAGKVEVNGSLALLPQTMVSENDKVAVNGELLKKQDAKVYFLLNKPEGYICTAKRHGKERIVLDLFPDVKERIFTIGRLDKNTAGLLLLTNDGHFANDVIHPTNEIEKEYLVKTAQEVSADHLKAISTGTLVEGVFVKPKAVSKVRKGTIKITIGEGKKREVRLLLETAGLTIKELIRIRIGQLLLGQLPVGTYRPLTEREQALIFE